MFEKNEGAGGPPSFSFLSSPPFSPPENPKNGLKSIIGAIIQENFDACHFIGHACQQIHTRNERGLDKNENIR